MTLKLATSKGKTGKRVVFTSDEEAKAQNNKLLNHEFSKTYRILSANEKIQMGDEFLAVDGVWRRTACTGHRAGEFCVPKVYRRKIA